MTRLQQGSRTKLKRLPERGSMDRNLAHAILDEGLICHVAFTIDDQPYVLPMAYARQGNDVLIHGSIASRLLNGLSAGIDCCVCVTLLDGLVLARSVFHHSMNYRSLVAFGHAELIVDQAEKLQALESVVEHIVPGRSADARAPNRKELAATHVLRFPLEEASIKMREGPPGDTQKDMSLPVWAGVIPLGVEAGAAVPDPAQNETHRVPSYAANYKRQTSGGIVHACLALLTTALLALQFADAESKDSPPSPAAVETVVPVQTGHHVGGVTVDILGNVYVADFDNTVWKITSEGEWSEFATGFYGASGNAIDNRGNLLQSAFYENRIYKVNRRGEVSVLVEEGLSGPVGIAVNPTSGEAFVANCRGNTIARLIGDTLSEFAASDLLNCPNGITLDKEGKLYVVNFRDNRMLKIDAEGEVSLFAEISEDGLGHVYYTPDKFYVTAFKSHLVYEVSMDGEAKVIAGTGERGIEDGPATEVRLSFPNGIVVHPYGNGIYINEYVNEDILKLPRRATVRRIVSNP